MSDRERFHPRDNVPPLRVAVDTNRGEAMRLSERMWLYESYSRYDPPEWWSYKDNAIKLDEKES